MGRIREILGKAGDRAFGTPEQRQERRMKESRLKEDLKREENLAYEKEARKQAREKGRRRARQPTGLQRIGMFADNVSKAAGDFVFEDPFAPKRQKKKQRKKTTTTYY